MNPASEDIKNIIESVSSLALVFGTDLFIGHEPEKPALCTTIYDTPAGPPQLALNPDEKHYFPTVQIRQRGGVDQYIAAWQRLNDIAVELHGRHNETWNGTIYTLIQCSSGATFIGRDEERRPLFVANFDIKRV